MTVSPVIDQARQLVAHIKALKGLHRASLTPTFGQVETMFDLTDDLERLLDAGVAVERAARPCTRPRCGLDATTMVGSYPYCAGCGDQARALLRSLEAFGVAAPSGTVPSWPAGGGRVIGPDPRD